MCSRVCLSTGIAEIRSRFGISGETAHLRHDPHWNVAAGQTLPVIRYSQILNRRRLVIMRWGLIPAWARNAMIVCSNLYARAHSAETDGLAQPLSAWRRCLVPVDNFYEWRARDKQPFAVALADRQIMTLAGVWNEWVSPTGARIECFAILTTDVNDLLAPLCERMPAIVAPEAWRIWLGEEPADSASIERLLGPCPDDRLLIWPVDRRLNSAKNDDPRLLGNRRK